MAGFLCWTKQPASRFSSHFLNALADLAFFSIDSESDAIVQRVIRSKFASHTIIAVAHKLDTILDFDKVAVLDRGELKEYDSPYTLLNDPGSAFARLYNSSKAEVDEAS